MPIGGPPVAPSVRSFLGVARELTMGTAVGPTNTIPVDKGSYSPEDMPKFLPDEALRGSMAGLYNEIIGPADASFSFGGPNFLDVHGFMLDNLFGDLSSTGSNAVQRDHAQRNRRHPRYRRYPVTVASATGYAAGSAVMIDSGSVAEVVVLSAAPSGTLLTFGNDPLRFPHQPGCQRLHGQQPVHAHIRAAEQPARLRRRGRRAAADPHPHRQHEPELRGVAGDEHQRGTRIPGCRRSAKSSFSGNAEHCSTSSSPGTRGSPSLRAARRPTSSQHGPRGELARQHLHRRHRAGQPRHGHRRVDRLDEEAAGGLLDGRREPVAVHHRPRADIGHGRPFVHDTVGRNPTSIYVESWVSVRLYRVSRGRGARAARCLSSGRVTFCRHEIEAWRVEGASGFRDSFVAVSNASDVGGSGGLGPCTVTLQNAIATY